MKKETKLKVTHYNCWEVWVDMVECRIEQHNETFYSYINGKWTEWKDSSLDESLDTILREIGIEKKERENLIKQWKRS